MVDKNVSCIVCQKPLEEVDALDGHFYPYDGLEFITRGHYGSTVFDPVVVEGAFLRVCICDKCIVKGIKSGQVIGAIDHASLEEGG